MTTPHPRTPEPLRMPEHPRTAATPRATEHTYPGGTRRPPAPAGRAPGGVPGGAKELIASCLINLLAPVGGYFLVHRHVPSETLSLALATAIPVVRTLWTALSRRRVDPLGVLGAVGYGAAVLVSYLMGGSSLPVKFIEPVITGVLGLALLGSLAAGRPLLLALAHRGTPPHTMPPHAVHTARVITAVIAPTLLLHAAVHITFALTLSTGAFLIWSRVVGWGVLLAGAAVVYWYVRSRRPRAAV